MREVVVTRSAGKLQQSITVGPHHLLSDEPTALGGDDGGPDPKELLLSALGACTAMTLQLYAARKEWPVERVTVTLTGEGPDREGFHVQRALRFDGALDEEQRARLVEIANKCPVHKILTGSVDVTTTDVTGS